MGSYAIDAVTCHGIKAKNGHRPVQVLVDDRGMVVCFDTGRHVNDAENRVAIDHVLESSSAWMLRVDRESSYRPVRANQRQ